jgi:hypothetical protein
MIDAELERQIWGSIFEKGCMDSTTPSDSTLIVTEPLFNFAPIQESLDEMAFEEFGFDGFFRAPATDLAAYRNFRAGGAHKEGCVVVDSGFAFTHVVPYFNCKPSCMCAPFPPYVLSFLVRKCKRTPDDASLHAKRRPFSFSRFDPSALDTGWWLCFLK